jgi:hypothetical protein
MLESYNDFDINRKAEFLGFIKNGETDLWDIDRSITLGKPDLKNRTVPFKIGFVNGDFTALNLSLLSAENLPVHVNGNMNITGNVFNSLRDLPTKYVERKLVIGRGRLNDISNNLERVRALRIESDFLPSINGIENLDCHSLSLYDLPNIKSLEGSPKSLVKLSISKTSVKNLEHMGRAFEVFINECEDLTSLKGIQNSVQKIKILKCPNLPTIIQDFAVNINLHGFEDYHLDLLKFAVKANRESELDDLEWPDDIKSKMPELIRSFRGITKYNI